MKTTENLALTLALLLLAAGVAAAQSRDEQARDDQLDPKLVHWQYFVNVRLPAGKEEYFALPIPPRVFAKAQDDLRDLRLVDADGARIPYELRILRAETKQTNVPAMRSDAGPGMGYFQFKLDLGKVAAPGYNEIEINSPPGGDFRRRLEVFGDNDPAFAGPQRLFENKKYVLRLHDKFDDKVCESRRFRLAFMQFPNLRVRIYADPEAEDAKAEEKALSETTATVRQAIVEPGKFVTEPATLSERELIGEGGQPASAWMIDLPDKMPCEKLTFEVVGTANVQRPFNVQAADKLQPRRDLFGNRTAPELIDKNYAIEKLDEKAGIDFKPARGWHWRTEGGRHFLDIHFPEVIAKRLRLTITDAANEPLKLKSVTATYCVRQLIFVRPDASKFKLPLKLYVGNAAVRPPDFDLAQKLPPLMTHPPTAAEVVGGLQNNPNYQSPPQTLSERMPWLVDIVLGAACLVLLAILASLARTAMRRHDQGDAKVPGQL